MIVLSQSPNSSKIIDFVVELMFKSSQNAHSNSKTIRKKALDNYPKGLCWAGKPKLISKYGF